eukprot:326017-Rhodomonas_salina.1
MTRLRVFLCSAKRLTSTLSWSFFRWRMLTLFPPRLIQELDYSSPCSPRFRMLQRRVVISNSLADSLHTFHVQSRPGTHCCSKAYSAIFEGNEEQEADLHLTVFGYDSDHAGDQDTHSSVTGYVVMLNGAAVSWQSTR